LRRVWVTLGLVIFVAVIAAAGFVALAASGTLTPHHTINGAFVLLDTDPTYSSIKTVGSGCEGTGGYSDLSPGAQVTLRDGDGKTLGSTALSEGSGSSTSCTFTFSIPNIPEVPFYAVEISHRGQVTNSLADMRANGWTFSLSIGK